ncbi:MAG: hypothetical protein ACK5WS_04425 [Alphaproteobacteria bacterium]|jgi:hypothetical protein|nr:hypothetical protein [Candidatus Jidaibacter sp.]
MTLPLSVIKDLDRAIELVNNIDLETIRLQKRACDLINKSKFTELLKEFEWHANVSSVISVITLADHQEIKELAVKEAVSDFIKEISHLMFYLDEKLDTTELDTLFSKYEDSIYESEIDDYLDDKVFYNDCKFITNITMDRADISIKHSGVLCDEVLISGQFDYASLESWINEHTLVQDGHLVFVE